ncbi:MAG: hypothetical protein ACLR6O_04085 [Eubacterium sp.]
MNKALITQQIIIPFVSGVMIESRVYLMLFLLYCKNVVAQGK